LRQLNYAIRKHQGLDFILMAMVKGEAEYLLTVFLFTEKVYQYGYGNDTC